MTRKEREKALETLKNEWGFEVISDDAQKALDMAIDALETIGHLTDRPCGVCEYHGEYGCCKWDCAFKGV
jgi:hypothetical protein